ncbi:condensin-2 complex subunit H2 [Andrographis paniculata]|uniref:condensin-2 complex subunit H2 n=1 Tax=Andrographis paniculata TaxID=175694 RepID=UPI0021E8B94C|nr:condensin-2 complex subunit H2 [Andrographis paniculata]
MNSESENPDSSSLPSSSGRFLEAVRPQRDLESNWTVDLAKNLEEYLLKICSGQVSGDDGTVLSVNFAEAALLLQGSVQVYSRKVEYLYSLVLQALNFISHKSQEEQAANGSPQSGASGAHNAEADTQAGDPFWISDDVPVDPKNLLDSKAVLPSQFVKPPSNLVVLEGECLDAGGDAGELDSYLLATTDLYREFILLDPRDAVEIDKFLDSKSGKGPSYKGSLLTPNGGKVFQSPSRHSGQNSSARKEKDCNFNKSPSFGKGFENNGCSTGRSPLGSGFHADVNDGCGFPEGFSGPGDMDDDSDYDDDDPWKPLDPHEPGNLKVKPYKKAKPNRRVDFNSKKQVSLAAEFPVAKLHGLISAEFNEIWEEKFGALTRHQKSHSMFEKLRKSLVEGETKVNDAFTSPDINAEEDGYDSDQGGLPPEFDIPDNIFDNEEVLCGQEKHEETNAQENLEDLCRSHLDSLLATLTESEKQTELATRVSTWKQNIEKNLEEQDARPPFDIHIYGEKVLEKLSSEGDDEGNNELPFIDVVKGQEKHDVARTFSALLQLVNNGDVDLVKNKTTFDSEMNPFSIRLVKKNNGGQKKKGIWLQSAKKRAKSPQLLREPKAAVNLSSCRLSQDVGNGSSDGSRVTPEGKKRRKSKAVAVASPPLGMQFDFVG